VINRAKKFWHFLRVREVSLPFSASQTDGLYVAALPTREPSMSNLILSQSSILTLSHLSYKVSRNAADGITPRPGALSEPVHPSDNFGSSFNSDNVFVFAGL